MIIPTTSTPAIRVGTPPDLPGAIAASGSDGGTEKTELRKAAEGFEAMFIRQLLDAARKAEFGGDDLFGSQGQETFTEMRDARFAEVASQSGGFGIADMLEAQLIRQLGPPILPQEGS